MDLEINPDDVHDYVHDVDEFSYEDDDTDFFEIELNFPGGAVVTLTALDEAHAVEALALAGSALVIDYLRENLGIG